MTLHADAIYEGGVLRPLVPLALPENQVVSLAISTPTADNDEEIANRRRAALLAYIASVEAEPIDPPNDNLSNRDHDRIIYGDIR